MTSPLLVRGPRVLDGANRHHGGAAYVLTIDALELDALPGFRLMDVIDSLGGISESHVEMGPIDIIAQALDVLGHHDGGTFDDGGPAGELVVALGWQDLTNVTGVGDGLVELLELTLSDVPGEELLARALALRAEIATLPPGRAPDVVTVDFPVVGVTGTNGKTTTTRLLVRMARAAGHRVTSCDTDGVRLDDEILRTGDWSGPGGAEVALSAAGATLGVLEIARGGLLRSGVGVSRLDVGVLLNVREDHLGEGGIDTLSDLAELKGAVVRAVGAGGTAVLNAEDPLARTRPVAAGRTARWFAVTPDALPGPGVAVVDGRIAVLGDWSPSDPAPSDRPTPPRADEAEPLVALAEVPVTVAGASRAGTENALAATTAALTLGLPRAAIVEGLRSFGRDPLDNRGRLERWEIDGRIVLHDVAHNPDGLGALLGLGRALGPDGARLIALIGTAGDRRDEDLRSLGRVAGELADVVLTADKPRYLRDREAGELRALLAAGVREAGSRVTHLASELEGVETAWSGSRPGDVLALCVHEQRDEVEAWLREHGAAPLGG